MNIQNMYCIHTHKNLWNHISTIRSWFLFLSSPQKHRKEALMSSNCFAYLELFVLQRAQYVLAKTRLQRCWTTTVSVHGGCEMRWVWQSAFQASLPNFATWFLLCYVLRALFVGLAWPTRWALFDRGKWGSGPTSGFINFASVFCNARIYIKQCVQVFTVVCHNLSSYPPSEFTAEGRSAIWPLGESEWYQNESSGLGKARRGQ